jgi:hypothetical protein
VTLQKACLIIFEKQFPSPNQPSPTKPTSNSIPQPANLEVHPTHPAQSEGRT